MKNVFLKNSENSYLAKIYRQSKYVPQKVVIDLDVKGENEIDLEDNSRHSIL